MNKEFARGLNHCLGNTYDSIDKNRHVDNFLLQGLGLFIINLQCRGKGDICSNLERECMATVGLGGQKPGGVVHSEGC